MSNEQGPLGPTDGNDSHTRSSGDPGGSDGWSDPTPTHALDSPVTDSVLDDSTAAWREQYLRERKRSRILMATTVGAVVLLAGSLVYTATQTVPTSDVAAAVGSAPSGSGVGGGTGPGGEPGAGGGSIVERFFNADGSVDQEAINEFNSRIEQFGGSSLMGDRIKSGIDALVASGDITQEQADELMAALGLGSADAAS